MERTSYNNTKPKKFTLQFAQVLPDNERVRNKLKVEKLEEEERNRIELENKKKNEELNSEELLRYQQQERERKQKLKELENQKEDIKERTMEIQKRVLNFF